MELYHLRPREAFYTPSELWWRVIAPELNMQQPAFSQLIDFLVHFTCGANVLLVILAHIDLQTVF